MRDSRGNRKDCAWQFKAAWERFADDEANPAEFLDATAAALSFTG